MTITKIYDLEYFRKQGRRGGKLGAKVSPEERIARVKRGWRTRRKNTKKLSTVDIKTDRG